MMWCVVTAGFRCDLLPPRRETNGQFIFVEFRRDFSVPSAKALSARPRFTGREGYRDFCLAFSAIIFVFWRETICKLFDFSIVLAALRGQQDALCCSRCRLAWSRINVCVHDAFLSLFFLQHMPHALDVQSTDSRSVLVAIRCTVIPLEREVIFTFFNPVARRLFSLRLLQLLSTHYTITGISGYALACASMEFCGKS